MQKRNVVASCNVCKREQTVSYRKNIEDKLLLVINVSYQRAINKGVPFIFMTNVSMYRRSEGDS